MFNIIQYKLRRRMETFLTYQQFSESCLDRIKILIRNIFIFMNELLFHQRESEKNIGKIISMKNKFKGEVLLLGSGPSLLNLNIEQIRYFQQKGGFIAATNTFILSKKFQEIKLDFYFVMDPLIVDEKRNNQILKKLKSLIQKGQFDGYLIQPANRNNLIANYEKISYIDTRSTIIRRKKNLQPNKRTYMNYSVVLSAIYTLKYYGFDRILFAGLDSNFSRFYSVMDNNKIKFVKEGYYAYDDFNFVRNTAIENENELEYPEIPYTRDMRDILYADAYFLNDLRKISDGCINVGHDNTNDVAPRASLLFLKN